MHRLILAAECDLVGDDVNNQGELSPVKRALLELRDLRAKFEGSERRCAELERAAAAPIAVIGLGCRYPGGADGPEAFWRLLRDGVDATSEIPPERWDAAALYDPDPAAPGKAYTRRGAFLKDLDRFDPDFFGIAAREAELMDPQQRLLLEVAWEALEHAGQPPTELFGGDTGVFVGIVGTDFLQLREQRQRLEDIDPYFATGVSHSVAAGRLSYVLGFRGPCVALDTACSSSLVAVHLACQSLRAGECGLALAGGVNLMLTPEMLVNFCKAQMMSPDGRCRTFDAAADGYGRGEGCGVVALKRLADALADGDNVLALIRGSAVNQDGRSSGLTAPNGPAQQAVIRRALKNAGVAPGDVDYVEAHGTGTALGDPIEAQALAAALGEGRPPERPLLIGSVKTNIGHTEGAAGVAGLIKLVLALQGGELPAHLHFAEPNPRIPWDELPLRVVTERTPWRGAEGKRQKEKGNGKSEEEETGRERIAGVSSFGFSGTNAHVVVSEAPEQLGIGAALRIAGRLGIEKAAKAGAARVEAAKAGAERSGALERPVHLLTLSARDDVALRVRARDVARLLADGSKAEAQSSVGDVCFAANAGRSHFVRRLAAPAAAADELRELLEQFADGGAPAGLILAAAAGGGDVAPGAQPEVVFLFTGQGAQYAGMGRELYETQPVFRDALDRCAEILRDQLDRPLIEILYPDDSQNSPIPQRCEAPPQSPIDQTVYTQPALFAVEYALAELWRSWGVEPTAVLGHSVGEYVAACVAGIFGLEDGLRLIAARGRLMQALPAGGRMAAVFAAEAQVAEAVAPHADSVSIAAYNGPENIVISGAADGVEAALARLREDGVRATELNVSHAFHSPLMDPMLDEFEAVAAGIEYAAPRIRLLSNATGDVAGPSLFDAKYWRDHVRQPVRFAQSMQTLNGTGIAILLELGPHPVLLGMARHCLEGERSSNPSAMRSAAPIPNRQLFLPSLRKGESDWRQILRSLGELYVGGAALNWRGFDAPYRRRMVALPTYPFQRERCWPTPEGEPMWRPREELPGAPPPSPELAATLWERVAGRAGAQARQTPIDLALYTYADKWAWLDRLTVLYVTRALSELGAFDAAGEALTAEGLLVRCGIKAAYSQLLARWLALLADAGALERVDSGFVCSAPSAEPPLAETLARARESFADAPFLLEYVERCGGMLADVLTGRENALETLFPGGSRETAEAMYRDWAVARYFNGIVRAAAEAAVAGLPPGRLVRALEIGAGTGGTTASVLPALPPGRTDYRYTDVSGAFFAQAERRFSDFPFVRYQTLDIERSPAEQGCETGTFDLVVAANVLHATRDLDATLKHALTLLAPGGLLLIYETTRHPAWFEITIGLIEGWQRFADEWRGEHPLLSAERWLEALRACGFERASAFPEGGSPAEILPNHVIVAQAPGALAARGEATGTAPSQKTAVAAVAPKADVLECYRAAPEEERLEVLVDFVRDRVRAVLRRDASKPLDRRQRLMDLGVDSLMAVELRNLLATDLGLEREALPATLIFDYPTPLAIAEHLQREVLEAARPAAAAEVEPAAATSAGAEVLAGMSEDEAEKLMLEMLDALDEDGH